MAPLHQKFALNNQIKRLDRRIAALQFRSRRYSWARLGIVLAGGLAVWAAATYLDSRAGWLTFLVALLIFIVVAYYHGLLHRWIEKFEIWRAIKSDYLARLSLDWDGIHHPALPPTYKRPSLDIDLDLTGPYSLHHLLDITDSRQGSQRLAEWITCAEPDPAQIEARQVVVGELALQPRFRDRLLLTFRQVSIEQLDGDRLLDWLAEDYPSGRLKWLLLISTLFIVLNGVLFILNNLNLIPAFWPITLVGYVAFYFYNSGTVSKFMEAIVKLDKELDKFKAVLQYLESYPLNDSPNLVKLLAPYRTASKRPSRQLRGIKWVTAAVGLRMNPVMTFFLNLFLPWDFFFALLADRYRTQIADLLPAWLETWYNLEALNSLATFAYLNPEYSFPDITSTSEPVFHTEGLGHPLLLPDEKVKNNFSIQDLGEVTIITGSNMAGKSTFIKTVGINLCLAYAGGPVDAAVFHARPFRLHTCIRISDSITDGFSYFYAEVKCLKKLLDDLRNESSSPLLYLIDEIFRGTNNRERLIGSRAYVQALIGAKGTGLLATHDLELASLADDENLAQNYHFRDHVQDGLLVFDYKIRTGPSPTTNALQIMYLEGLPVEKPAAE